MSNHPHSIGPDHPLEVDYEALPEDAGIAAHLFAGAFAGIMEHTVMYPIDSIKTRMQMLAAGQTSGSVILSILRISSSEGAYALWRGVLLVVLGAGPAHAVYFSVFEATKTALVNRVTNLGNTRWVTDETHPLIASGAGIAATVASDALMTPFDVLKQRMQVGEGQAASVRLLRTALAVYRSEGVGAFFVLYPTTLFTNIPFAALNFGFYEYLLLLLNPTNTYNPYYHCVLGGIAGGIAAALTNPLDCVKTALQTRGISQNEAMRHATGFVSAARVLYLQGGVGAFMRGWKPRIIFNVPSTAISWTAYEMAKELLLRN